MENALQTPNGITSLTICEIELGATWLPKGYPATATTFGEYIRQYRISHGYTASETAMELDVYESTIYKWEYGESHPQPKNIKKIIAFMGYDPRINNPLNIEDYEYIT
jgi:DNA-binding XRE family transcriptional regulator